MDFLTHDLRTAIRSLTRHPGFTVVAIVTLSLGIGAATSMFSVVHGVLLQPLPYPHSERLLRLYSTEQDLPGAWSGADFIDLAAQSKSYETVAGARNLGFAIRQDGVPQRIRGASVTPGFFRVFGLPPRLGRLFDPDIDVPGGERVVVLGNGLWQSRFAADPAIVGQTLELDGEAYTVVGVAPPGFSYPSDSQLWVASRYRVPEPPVPLGDDPAANRGADYFQVVARLDEGVSQQQARAEGMAFAARLAEAYPDTKKGEGFDLEPLQETLVSSVRPMLLALFGAVGLVLLIACANVANLLLARATGRVHEIAVRASLGASRRHLARQLLTESVLLGLAGGVGGALLALAGTKVLVSLAASELPRAGDVSVSLTVLVFTLAVSLVSGVLFGLTPVLWLTRSDPAATLREAGSRSVAGRAHGRTRSVLVVAELAVSLSLLVGAGLLARTLSMLQAVDPGFSERKALAARVWLPGTRFPEDDDLRTFQSQVLERVRALPGVASAGAVLSLPVDSGIGATLKFNIEGRRPADPGAEPVAGYQTASDGYFETIGIPILRGRSFTRADGPNDPKVAVVSEAFAKRFFPGEDPIGKRIGWGDPEDENFRWSSIVGVVGSTHHQGLDAEPRVEAYQPLAQEPWPFMTLVLRTTVDPGSLVEPLRQAVMQVSPNQPVEHVMTMEQILHDSLASRRLHMLLLWVYAGIALVLAAVGLYGVMSFSVAQRTRDIGIRIAVGASRGDIARLVLGEAGRLLVVGLLAGIAGALVLGRLLQSFLYQVGPADPVAFAVAAITLTVAALVAAWLPARRAVRTDPITSLRAE